MREAASGPVGRALPYAGAQVSWTPHELITKPETSDSSRLLMRVSSAARASGDSSTSDPTATSVVSMDSTDGAVQTTYHLAWQTC